METLLRSTAIHNTSAGTPDDGLHNLYTFPPVNKRSYKGELKGTIVRVYCGLEDREDQLQDIYNALKILS